MATLEKAHREWASRAADERYSSVMDMHRMALHHHNCAVETVHNIRDFTAEVAGDDVVLVGNAGKPAKLTNWSFGQIARFAEAPAGYLSSLPAPLGAQCLNNGLSAVMPSDTAQMLLHREGDSMTLRGATTEKYSRIWNCDVTARLLDVEARGVFQPAPAAFDGSRGLYLSDRDMFAFMVDNDRRIFETLPGGGLSRGFFVWNSEVGARSFGITTFYYEYVCGNHRVWGAKDVKEVRIRHVGEVQGRAWAGIEAQLVAYASASAADDELRIEHMRTVELGGTTDEVLDALLGLRNPHLGKRRALQAIELATQREDWYGNPRTQWAIAGAITEIARDLPNANERVALDRVGTQVMEAVF